VTGWQGRTLTVAELRTLDALTLAGLRRRHETGSDGSVSSEAGGFPPFTPVCCEEAVPSTPARQ
jgi:hypothetical protein